jgi:hypothetical protein
MESLIDRYMQGLQPPELARCETSVQKANENKHEVWLRRLFESKLIYRSHKLD